MGTFRTLLGKIEDSLLQDSSGIQSFRYENFCSKWQANIRMDNPIDEKTP